ncbi:tetratricopeptide repeat protein [Nonomuraea harbinensis]|uniref:Tetratricopeptide repeat protein n=1 Tax=Nonomuraea harbinensis TaxID=1286938 RepID=A0ABW1BYQ5_9ACTN|nr:tetratricopeptide repeat protein [Nonomuraea harbinensis]
MADRGDARRSTATRLAVWARRHLTIWITVATTTQAALLAITTMLMQLPGQSDSVITACIGIVLLLAALSVVLPLIGARAERKARTAEELDDKRRYVTTRVLRGSAGELPRLGQLSATDFGVTPTQYTTSGRDPYVPREPDDAQIRDALSAPGPPYPFVLVWGNTKAGKSRITAEAIRAVFPEDTVVLLPASGAALAELALSEDALPSGEGPAVVHLDDITVADLEVLTPAVLDAVARQAVLVATMTAGRRGQILKSGTDSTRVARTALSRAHRDGQGHELVFRPPTDAEREQAEALYPGETFRGSIAETLVGAIELFAKYKAGPDDDPAGCAIVQAAVDCRRAGLTRPVTDAELSRLFALYLPVIRAGVPATPDTFQQGLRTWAAVPVSSQVALLTADTGDGEAGWTALDHIVSADEGARPIHPGLWPELISIVDPSDARAIMYGAENRGEREHAIAAGRKAATSPHLEEAAVSAGYLGILLAEQGEVEASADAFRQAARSQNADRSSMATLQLGIALSKQGKIEAATDAFHQVIHSRNPHTAPLAALVCGKMLEEHGDLDAAQDAYWQAIRSYHPDHAPRAELNLGALLAHAGELSAAGEAFRRVIASNHPDSAPHAALNLGIVLASRGELAAAEQAFRQAIASGHPRHAPPAALGLDQVLALRRGEGSLGATPDGGSAGDEVPPPEGGVPSTSG